MKVVVDIERCRGAGVVVDILEDFRDELPKAPDEAGNDPVHRLRTAFRTCCLVVDAKRDAVK